MSKHTPGPWVIINHQIGGADGKEVGNAFAPGRPAVEQEANARLIAAAPDLLEALESILLIKPTPAQTLNWELYEAAQTAISKAKGTS